MKLRVGKIASRLMVASAAISITAMAAVINTVSTTISMVYTYSEHSDGIVLVYPASPNNECKYGYWYNRLAPGYSAVHSSIIAAYSMKSPVVLYGDTARPWSTYSNTCHLYLAVAT